MVKKDCGLRPRTPALDRAAGHNPASFFQRRAGRQALDFVGKTRLESTIVGDDWPENVDRVQ